MLKHKPSIKMAHGSVEIPATNVSPRGGATYSQEELGEILEYEKILQFRDTILAGRHPRVRIQTHSQLRSIQPDFKSNSHLLAHTGPSSSSNMTETMPVVNEGQINQSTSSSANIFSASRPTMSRNLEINPVLLEKSDDLIKAEIQLQRQRLERGLREQVEHQRHAARILLQNSEQLPDFDILEALAKAFEIVPHVSIADNESSSTYGSSGSKSFDENTFYSSLNESPIPSISPEDQRNFCNQNMASAINRFSSIENLRDVTYEPATSNVPPRRIENYGAMDNGLNPPLPTSVKPKERQLENNMTHYDTSYKENFVERERPVITRLDPREAGNTAMRKETNLFEYPMGKTSDSYQRYPKQGFYNEPTPAQFRNHNLPLVAPQPERVSPLPIASDSLILGAINGRHPSQVSALRHLPAFSSADTSPRNKLNEKKRDKKKRKVKDTSTPDSPYIKTEPKSPSLHIPFPSYKRQRSQYDSEPNYERPRPASNIHPQERMADTSRWPFRPQEQGMPYDSVGYDSRYGHNESTNVPQRISSAIPIRRPYSPQYFTPYLPSETRPRAVSNLVGGRHFEDRDYISEPITRNSVRPNLDSERARSPLHHNTQPGPLRKYLVDEKSGQYFYFSPTSIAGDPIASKVRYHDEDVAYERVPKRVVSNRVPNENYDSDNYLRYRRSPISNTYQMPIDNYENDNYLRQRRSPLPSAYRRVMTQPEYLTSPIPNQRSSRQRGYSVYPTLASTHVEEHDSYRVAQDYML